MTNDSNNSPGKKKKKSKKKKEKESFDPTFDKEKAKLKMFDPRGTQTLFRTLSRNHYNLLKMVDNKASIILTINSIITSLSMGAQYIAPDIEKQALAIGAKVLMNFSLLSMIFAVLSMLPHKYLGKKFKNSGYKGSLYASNFATNSLEEFRKEFERIMSSGQQVYDEMINDLYFLGQVIDRKQRMVWYSTIIFLIGLIATIIVSVSHGLNLIIENKI